MHSGNCDCPNIFWEPMDQRKWDALKTFSWTFTVITKSFTTHQRILGNFPALLVLSWGGGHFTVDDKEAAELLEEVGSELWEQAAEEANTFFVSVKKLSILCVKQPCFSTMIDEHFTKPHLKPTTIVMILSIQSYCLGLQIPVCGWSHFNVGGVYKKKKNSVKFYHDSLQGCLPAAGAANPSLIEEFPSFEGPTRKIDRWCTFTTRDRLAGVEEHELL
ncbi:hypothetical protein GQ600_8386 [Phytophthora cactorum]|nr:hypothetical protein GQ600_8386 [Phytophthora cactorum]